MNLNKELILIVLIISSFLTLDLWSKKWAEENLSNPMKFFNGKLQLTYVRNYGVAFNRLTGKKILILWINIALFLYLIYLLYTDPSNYIPYSFILAGGLGNFIIRVKKGYVIDFIHFNIRKWPVFNIADFGILFGVGAILIKELL